MHDDVTKTEGRIRNALAQRLRPKVVSDRENCSVSAFVCGEPVPVEVALSATYTPVQAGQRWGAPWSTTWFQISGRVPSHWNGMRVEATIDIGFSDRGPGFQAEGLVFTPDGTPVKAVQPMNNWVPVAERDGIWSCFVEAVAMPSFLVRREASLSALLGDRATMGTEPLYAFGGAHLVVIDEDALGLATDVEVLFGVMEELAATDPRRHEILRGLERCLDTYDLDEEPQLAREVLKDVMAAPAARTAHRISAVGHAHIDSAWLWPVRETIRKCARTFSNVAVLGELYPELVFACSQAQQWWWMKENYPTVFARMKEQVSRGQVVPVGGMWVESDTNVTGANRWSVSSCSVSASSFRNSGWRRRRCGSPTASGIRRAPSTRPPVGVTLVPHSEDFLERDRQVPSSHLLVGGHRRQPGFYPLPARGHVQRPNVAIGAGPCRP